MKKIIVLSFILSFLTLGHLVNAQVPNAVDGVTISASTNTPNPGESVEISIESFLFDLNSSSMIWTVNGKTYTSGNGIKKITLTAPKVGIPTKIEVGIKSPSGQEAQKTITIKSSSLDIIWESEGYTPPFFSGKTNFAYQNSVKFIAIPHLSVDGKTEIDPKTLVYTWKRDGKYVENGQGYGVQSVTIPADELPKDIILSVEVHNREQTVSTSGSVNLTPGEPSINFYEDNSLYGILFNKSLISNVPMSNREMKILAVPFSFTDVNQNSYVWSINNIEQSDLLRNRSITIRTKDDKEGSSNINLEIRNQNNILQGATNAFTVYFNKK